MFKSIIISNGKTLTCNNSLTLQGTDGATLNVGAGASNTPNTANGIVIYDSSGNQTVPNNLTVDGTLVLSGGLTGTIVQRTFTNGSIPMLATGEGGLNTSTNNYYVGDGTDTPGVLIGGPNSPKWPIYVPSTADIQIISHGSFASVILGIDFNYEPFLADPTNAGSGSGGCFGFSSNGSPQILYSTTANVPLYMLGSDTVGNVAMYNILGNIGFGFDTSIFNPYIGNINNHTVFGCDSSGSPFLSPDTSAGSPVIHFSAAGYVMIENLPTSDPSVPGALYQLAGVVHISL